MSPKVFEDRVAYLAQHYTPVTLDQVLETERGIHLPERAILVTFDDAYGSVARSAAPVLVRYDIPAVFFVNPAYVNGDSLSLDNLLCFTINTVGLDAINLAAQKIVPGNSNFKDLADVIQNFTSHLGSEHIAGLRAAILEQLDRNPEEEARNTKLHVTTDELRILCNLGFEIGNHTLSHVWCRNLHQADYDTELLGSRDELVRMTGHPVRTFSVPYGGSVDLTTGVKSYLLNSGHHALFLVEGLLNGPHQTLDRLDRVSLKGVTDHETFTEMELLPRLRKISRILRLRQN